MSLLCDKTLNNLIVNQKIILNIDLRNINDPKDSPIQASSLT